MLLKVTLLPEQDINPSVVSVDGMSSRYVVELLHRDARERGPGPSPLTLCVSHVDAMFPAPLGFMLIVVCYQRSLTGYINISTVYIV